MKTGIEIKKSLGLSDFKKVYIQKIIGYTPRVFVITVDSRHDGKPLTTSYLNKLQSITVSKIKNPLWGFTSELVLSPVIELDDFSGNLNKNDLVIFRDIAGEYLMNDKLYEIIL